MTVASAASEDALRAARVWTAVALGVALTGYAVGRSQVSGPRRPDLPGPTSAPSTGPRGQPRSPEGVAPAWSELATTRRGRNVGFRTIVPATSPLYRGETPPPASDELRAAALARRAERRAYDGAPPVIPHPVDPVSVRACLACHEHGLSLGSVTAPALPHAKYTSCTQCHAPAAPAVLADRAGPPVPNAFEGLPAPAGGERAGPGAPPVIPHATWMRDECMSCHGPAGAVGLRTSHPWRQSCTQCHAPRASSP